MTRDREDWATRSKGTLDLVLVLAGVALVALGLFMALTDYGREVTNARALAAVGETAAFDASYRLAFVPPLTWLTVIVSVGAAWRAFRVRGSPRLKRLARRQVMLLVAGATVLDVAFLVDQQFGLAASHVVRAVAIDPLYAIAGFLVAGAAWRLRSLIRPLPPVT